MNVFRPSSVRPILSCLHPFRYLGVCLGIGQKKGSDEIVGTLMFSVVETRGIEPLTSKMRI